MKRWAILALVGAASSAAACASILGIEDGILESPDQGGEAGIPNCAADGGDQPNAGAGIFVATDGKDTLDCGGEANPCLTITQGLLKASDDSKKNIVYVASPVRNTTYNETVALSPGITIEGGWTVVGAGASAQWNRVCALNDPTELPTLIGTDPITISAENINGTATLRYLHVTTKTAAAGESVYGLFATATSKPTTVILDNVLMDPGPGGDGKPGTSGMAGGPGTGACTPGTPVTPVSGANGDPAPAATFGATGVAAEAAGPGLSGTTGGSGVRGADGGCISCVTCAGGLGACASAPPSCGLVGSPGCGGQGGSGGGAGSSGGSSIGVYAWGGAIITVGGEIKSGKGGNGGSGGAGGPGGEGGIGPTGDPGTTCSTSCVNIDVACTATPNGTGAGKGGAGTLGAPGSNGGTGGGGAGGVSYAIVSGLDASVSLDGGTMLGSGTGGTNGDGTSSAQSGDRYP